jgi:hypothetical protein
MEKIFMFVKVEGVWTITELEMPDLLHKVMHISALCINHARS